MSTKPKKTTATSRKRVTASARAKVSTKKVRKVDLIHDGSFIQQMHPVSTVTTSSPTDLQPRVPIHESESVFSILSQIQVSNQQLADRLEKLERRQPDTFASAPTSSWHHPLLPQGTASSNSNSDHLISQHQATTRLTQQSSIHQNTTPPGRAQQQDSNLRSNIANLPRDAIIPGVDSQRKLPNVSEAVSSILASYEQQAKHESL